MSDAGVARSDESASPAPTGGRERAGQIAAQGWEFYAITAALFLTFAFPGFVWRYLLRRPK